MPTHESELSNNNNKGKFMAKNSTILKIMNFCSCLFFIIRLLLIKGLQVKVNRNLCCKRDCDTN